MTLCSVLSPIRKNNFSALQIGIKTDWSASLGMGHIQRMTTLLGFLNSRKNVTAFIVPGEIPGFFPASLRSCVKKDFDKKTDIIIRDMRDSSSGEIAELRRISPVLVIDDNGSGRDSADYRVDLLPNPLRDDSDLKGCFIYGYNFISSLEKNRDRTFEKIFDFALYPGNSPDDEYVEFLLSLLPEKSKAVLLMGANSIMIDGKKRVSLSGMSQAEIILSSRVVVSHFGITLYEGIISGCRTVSINPSEYHNTLSEMIKGETGLLNLGIKDSIDKGIVRRKLERLLNEAEVEKIEAGEVYKNAANGLLMFFDFVKGADL